MSDRKDHIAELKFMLEMMEKIKEIDSKPERKDALKFAINSLETDEAYQLEYEHIPYITLDELKEIREEIFKDLLQHSGTGEEVIQAYCDGLNKSLAILDKKTSELEGK